MSIVASPGARVQGRCNLLQGRAGPLGQPARRSRSPTQMRFSIRRPGRSTAQDLCWLTPTLAAGGADVTRDVRALARLGIRAVLDLQQETPSQGDRFLPHGLVYLKIP